MERVGVTFSGSATGAVGAARETSLAIDKVKVSAAGSSAPLRGMEKDLSRVERGAIAGSGAFRGMGRSIAFASGAFIGAAGFVEVIKSSIDVVLAAQTGIAKLDQAVTNAHASVKALSPILEEHAAAARLLGFTDDQTREAEAKLVTAFGATKHALGEVNVAADLARASNTDLATATRNLIMLQEGNARAAKQFGVVLPDLTKKQWDAKAATDGLTTSQEKGKTLYDELLPRIKAQGAAFAASPAGKIAEFHAEIQHLQESIGTGLLPVVDKYLTEVDAWLAKGKNQQKVTDDVKKVVEELAAALHDASEATRTMAPYVNDVAHAMGGWKKVIEGLLALKIGVTIAGWTSGLGKLTAATSALGTATLVTTGEVTASTIVWKASAGGLLAVVRPAEEAAAAVAGVGTAAAGAAGAAGLGGLLGKLAAFSKLAQYGFGGISDQVKITQPGGYHLQDGQWYKIGKNGQATKVDASAVPTNEKAGTAGLGVTATQKKELAYATKYGPGSGLTYTWGGVSPITGFDCSGYLMASYAAAGVTIPHNTVAQFNDPEAIVVLPGGEQPGDGVYFQSSGPGAAPQHCGIYIGGGKFIEYYSQGKPAQISDLATYPGYMGARRWLKIAASTGGGKTSPYGQPQTSGGGGTTTPTKPKKVAWVGATQATITTALGGITATLKGLPSTLDPVEKNAVAHIKAIQDSLHIHMTPAELAKDRVELTKWGKVLNTEISANAKVVAAAAAAAKQVFDRALSLDVSHILRDFDENYAAQTKAFNNVTSSHLKDMQTAFSRSQTVFDAQTSSALKGMQTAFQQQQAAFDAQTQKGLASFVVAQTAAEQALVAFDAANAASDEAKQRADIASQIADTQAQLDALGGGTPGTTTGGGSLIDISTGLQTTIAGNAAAGTDIVAQRQTLLDQLKSLQDQSDALDRQDQRAALQAAADASRVAADAQTTAQQQAYQDQRDAQSQALQNQETDREQAYQDSRTAQSQANQDAETMSEQAYQDARDLQAQALQDINDDQKLALQQHLDDLGASLDAHTITWKTYLAGLAKLGVVTTGLINPNTGQVVGGPSPILGQAPGGGARGGTAIAFATGTGVGGVPGQYVGRDDTVLARVTPGEDVLTRSVSKQLGEFLASGGQGGGPTVAIFNIDGREFARATAAPMSAEQARQIGYTIQRG